MSVEDGGLEVWKVISDFPNYAISDLGRVKRLTSRTCARAGSMLKQAWRGGNKTDEGYLAVDLCKNGGKKTCSVHVLVADAFLSSRPQGLIPNHVDGVRAHNHAVNLEWATQSRNVQHAYDIGLSNAKGERNSQAKLTEADVLAIRAAFSGFRGQQARIARAYGVSPTTVRQVVGRKVWPHI